jgi:hypothetical protein
MHDERSCPDRKREVLSPALTDANAERRVLHAVLEANPELFTERELVREVVDEPANFMERDTAERAVQALVAVGLFNRCHPLIVASRAALRFEALEAEDER